MNLVINMKMRMIKCVLFLLSGVFILGLGDKTSYVRAAETIDQKTFPDANFRQYVSDYVDKNKDGILSDAEIQSVKRIKIQWQDTFYENITDYQGIGCFTELRDLEIHGVQHSSTEDDSSIGVDIKLDISQNTKMTRFWC